VIDDDGFRLNVGMMLTNDRGQLFWGRRIYQDAWQFPQGGINEGEEIEDALYRELYEEVGVSQEDVSLICVSEHWFTYLLPKRLVRMDTQPVCIGQKQKWVLLKLLNEKKIKLDASIKPEFDDWCWVNYWFPLSQVVPFKREVYRQALLEFAPKVMTIHPLLMSLDSL